MSTHNICFHGEKKNVSTFHLKKKKSEAYLEYEIYFTIFVTIGLDKSGYQVNIFLISPQKHMLWVLIRSALARRF